MTTEAMALEEEATTVSMEDSRRIVSRSWMSRVEGENGQNRRGVPKRRRINDAMEG